jgi:hypothetical protein
MKFITGDFKMDAKAVYQKAIQELYRMTHGKFERDENKAIELFGKLVGKGTQIHCDEVKEICREAGYDEDASRQIGQIYDCIDILKRYKKSTIVPCWTEEMIDKLYE